jgi:methionyl-tRNA synthetase
MITQYREGVIPEGAADESIAKVARETIAQYRQSFDNFAFSRGLESVWALIGEADRYIVQNAPWKLVKEPAAAVRLNAVLYTTAEVVRLVTALVSPVMPEAAQKIWAQLGMNTPVDAVRFDTLDWGQLTAGQKIAPAGGVFPRLDARSTIDKILELEEKESVRQQAILGHKPAAFPPAGGRPPAAPPIHIDDFGKVDLRVGLVKEAARVKGADKLLHLSVDIGEERPRSIVAGIALAYEPEELIGRKVVIVANLEPRKLRGIESQGMIVAASMEDTPPVLAGFLEDVPVGARLK